MAESPPDELVRRLHIAADHPAFEGHFPGRPLLPGVALVAEALEAALAEPTLAACLGVAPQLEVVKFLNPVLPGTSLSIRFRRRGAGVDFSIVDGDDRVAASGRFTIVAGLAAAP